MLIGGGGAETINNLFYWCDNLLPLHHVYHDKSKYETKYNYLYVSIIVDKAAGMVADIASDQAANKSLIVDMVDDSVPRMILFFWGGFFF